MHNGRKKGPVNRPVRRMRTIMIITGILLVIVIGTLYVLSSFTGEMTKVSLEDTPDEELGISTDRTQTKTEDADEIVNLAIFGVDTEGEFFSADKMRSDTIIIASVNKTKSEIKLISILRDSKVPIEGHEPQKINAAYMYGSQKIVDGHVVEGEVVEGGGAKLAIKTINQNFGTDIRNYLTINFAQLASIVDYLGGIEVEISEEEIDSINRLASEYSKANGTSYDPITDAGYVHFTGIQALAYSRVRDIDSDTYRADRQHKVMTAVLAKAKNLSKSDLAVFAQKFMGIVETSMTVSYVLEFLSDGIINYSIEFYTVPDAAYETDLQGGLDEHEEWVWTYDIDAAADRIHGIIYGE